MTRGDKYAGIVRPDDSSLLEKSLNIPLFALVIVVGIVVAPVELARKVRAAAKIAGLALWPR